MRPLLRPLWSYGVDAPTARIESRVGFAGSTSCSLSRIFGWRARGLYPLARGGRRIRPALWMAPALMVCAIEGGAGGFLFRFFLGGAGELRGHCGRQPASTRALPCVVLSRVWEPPSS